MKNRPKRGLTAAAMALLVFQVFLFSRTAFGQSGVIPEACKEFVSPVGALSYENAAHKRWYISWWDGKCKGLPAWPFCQSKPYWGTFIEPVLNRNPNADRHALLKDLCKLGEIVGHEFARDNDWRCIDRDDVAAWASEIGNYKGNITQKLAALKSRAEARIRGSRPAAPCVWP